MCLIRNLVLDPRSSALPGPCQEEVPSSFHDALAAHFQPTARTLYNAEGVSVVSVVRDQFSTVAEHADRNAEETALLSEVAFHAQVGNLYTVPKGPGLRERSPTAALIND